MKISLFTFLLVCLVAASLQQAGNRYFRSDHFPFALIGVPSLFARGNCDSREHGKEWAADKEKEYLSTMYYKPADNYYPEMDFEGIAEDAKAAFEVAWRIVTSDIRPAWKPDSEFANIRSIDN
jgi:Zn-dependent M28 family amino/carboxypeptidase